MDTNELQARAMEAMLNGDMETYEKLNKLLENPDNIKDVKY